MGKGKKYNEALSKLDRSRRYGVEEGMALLKDIAYAGYDETVEVCVNLGVNPKHADQMVRGAVILPHGTGKQVRVLVFAKGEKEAEALEAGADFVGSDDLVAKIQDGWFDFDTTIATPNMMVQVGRIGRLLGPRGLMPNPKVGTVTFDVAEAVRAAKAGKVAFRTDKSGIVHAGIGKKSFGVESLSENLMALMDQLMKLKPSVAKGVYVKNVTVATTHSPGIRLDSVAITNHFRV